MTTSRLPFIKDDLRVDIEISEIEGNLVRVTHIPTQESECEDCITGSVLKAKARVIEKLYKRIAGGDLKNR